MRCDFVSKIVKISFLFTVHVHEGKELKTLLTNQPNCQFSLLR